MYVYYDETNGRLLCAVEAANPDVLAPPNPGTPLYLDDTQYAALWNNGSPDLTNWTIQNGVPVHTPIPDSQLLPVAQQAQITAITQGYEATLIGGFTSKTTGHAYKTDDVSMGKFTAQVTQLLQNTSIASVNWLTTDAGVVSHTRDEFIGAFNDGIAWEQAQFTQEQTLIAQVNAATTVSAVQAIAWAEATY